MSDAFHIGWDAIDTTRVLLEYELYLKFQGTHCVSTPRRSACIKQSATIAALVGGTPLPIRTPFTKDFALDAVTCWYLPSSSAISKVVVWCMAIALSMK